MTTEEILIDKEQLSAWLANKESISILDIRPIKECEEYAIPGSIHVAVYDKLKAGDVDAFAGISIPENQLLVTVCGGGKLSITAAEKLNEMGYKAFSLKGGLKVWLSE